MSLQTGIGCLAPSVGFQVLEMKSGNQRTFQGPSSLGPGSVEMAWKMEFAHPDPLVWEWRDRKGWLTDAEDGGRARCCGPGGAGACMALVPAGCFLTLWWAHMLLLLPGEAALSPPRVLTPSPRSQGAGEGPRALSPGECGQFGF